MYEIESTIVIREGEFVNRKSTVNVLLNPTHSLDARSGSAAYRAG